MTKTSLTVNTFMQFFSAAVFAGILPHVYSLFVPVLVPCVSGPSFSSVRLYAKRKTHGPLRHSFTPRHKPFSPPLGAITTLHGTISALFQPIPADSSLLWPILAYPGILRPTDLLRFCRKLGQHRANAFQRTLEHIVAHGIRKADALVVAKGRARHNGHVGLVEQQGAQFG